MSLPAPRSRLFVALPIPDPVRALLAGHLARCAAVAPQQRWSPASNLHLTLRFLGWLESDAAERVGSELATVRHRGFTVTLGGVGRFGSATRPRVLWLGVEDGLEPLRALAEAVGEACRRAGEPGDERTYNPHLTLCRVRPAAPLPRLPAPPPIPPWGARSFTLFESRPGRGGSRYLPLRNYPIGASSSRPGDAE
ncbi:MAG: RNA 2',3'-cyclic phosphodiesterase [Candidatus Dormibacteraceae bacterium]